MKRKILGAAIVALVLSAVPVNAESIFDQASRCIASWEAPCAFTSTCKKTATTKDAEGEPACQMDVLGNKVPTKTVK